MLWKWENQTHLTLLVVTKKGERLPNMYSMDAKHQLIGSTLLSWMVSLSIKYTFLLTQTNFNPSMNKYTLGKKGCYTPIEDNKTNVDRTFVFPLGWNWHDMDPWLFPNEIRHYLWQTFNARSSGIVELRNHSIGGRSPKSIFTLWQLWINICIFFQKFFWLFEQCPVQPLWLLGMRCLHLPVRALKPPSHSTATMLRPWRPRESTRSSCGRQISEKRSSVWLQ